MSKFAPHPAGSRTFQFEARERGRLVLGRISARTLFSAMRILRLTGLEDIRIREVAGEAAGPAETPADR